MQLIIDYSHLGRKTTGIERISEELFSASALAPFETQHIRAHSVKEMIYQQWIGLPALAAKQRNARILFPGFPPSIAASVIGGERAIPYIHDLFLLQRTAELNRRAKLYMRPSFAYAVKHLDTFMVNSEKTEAELRQYCRAEAQIIKYRPQVRNVFGFSPKLDRDYLGKSNTIKMVMLGTVEPRKNYIFAEQLAAKLAQKTGLQIELNVVGRNGWGADYEALQRSAHVKLHGYLSGDEIRALVADCHFYLSTSLDEGLGLPLLEMQYACIPVVASDIPVYREVMADAGLFIDITQPERAAEQIINTLSDPQKMQHYSQAALSNIERWNQLGEQDKQSLLQFLAS